MPVTKKRKIELKIENATSYDITILDNRVKQLEGLISDEDGITVDFSDYYKKQEVDELIQNVDVDLSNYATIDQLAEEKDRVEEQLAEKQDVIDDLDEIREKANSSLSWMDKNEIQEEMGRKQDAIEDLDEIRSGAALGATAIQEHQSLADYALKSEIPDISGKQDIISDLDEIRSKANSALQQHQSLAAYALKSEIPDISGKQDVISDLATIRAGAALGATALQEHQDISGKQDIITDLDTIRNNANAAYSKSYAVEAENIRLNSVKADKTQLANYYTKTETDANLNNNYYTKTEIDAQLDGIDEILVKILE